MTSPYELATLLDALRQLQRRAPARAALATLTRTRGSTFRRAGTRMLVLADGSVACELSGGCPQRDIVARAQEAIADDAPRLLRYNANSNLDVLMEMGCDGELEVLLEPLSGHHATAFVDALSQCLQQRRSAHMAMLFAIDDVVITPRRLLWCATGAAFDGLGDAALSRAIVAAAASIDSTRALTLRLPAARGLADVLIEPIAPPHALVVIGSSAAARALLMIASALGWQTTLVDNDPRPLAAAGDASGMRTVCAEPATLRARVALDAHTSVVVMTHNLERDIAYLAALRGAPVAYVGTLGSRERVARMRQETQLAGLRLHAPAGLDIGSETPEEIALAVAAEIMAVINGRSGGPLRDNDGAIH